MTPPNILVAGIGNIFLGDDAFGVEVARRLTRRRLPDGVRVVDFGIRGFHLAYALLDDHDGAILIDATPRGGPPGTLYVIKPEIDGPTEGDAPETTLDSHTMDPVKVLRLVKAMGGQPKRVLVVGCEPATLDPREDGRMDLSDAVHAALDEAVVLVESVIADLIRDCGEEAQAVGGRVAE